MQINFIAIILISLIFIVINALNIKNKNTIFLIMAFVCLGVILIIRKPAQDLIEYLRFFNILKNKPLIEVITYGRFEPLYLILNKAIGLLWKNELSFIIITSLFALVGPYFFIKKYSKNYLFSIILFIALGTYHYSFYIIRQAIAITLILKSIDYIIDKKIYKFIFCIIIATLIHKSSILFLIAYPISNFVINKKNIIIYGFINLFVFLFKGIGLNIVTQWIYSAYAGEIINDGFERLLLLMLMIAFFFVIEHFLKKNEKEEILMVEENIKEDRITQVCLNIALMSIPFQILATEISVISRIANVFIIPFIILIPNIINKLKNIKNKNILSIGIMLSATIYTILFVTEKTYEINII